MKAPIWSVLAVWTILATASTAVAVPGYIGYSGAPGANGTCAGSCHGGAGGTVQVSGFPAEYSSGNVYTITISHSGGSPINQFNGSCRVGVGSVNAGVIAAGTNTVTYNTGGETNGIHLTTTDLDTASFLWTAPGAGTGDVRLYVAAHQGSYSGPNTVIVLTATEQITGVRDGDPARKSPGCVLYANSPNPFRGETFIGFVLSRATSILWSIHDASGRSLESHESALPAGFHRLTWNASGRVPGIYFLRLQAGTSTLTTTMVVY